MTAKTVEREAGALEQLAQWLEVQLAMFRQVSAELDHFEELFSSDANEKINSLLAVIQPWADAYANPPAEILKRVIEEMQLAPVLQGALTFRAEDASAAKKALESHEPPGEPVEQWSPLHVSEMLASAMPIERHFRSMVHYGVTMDALIVDARAGHDKALGQAVRIDPSVITGTALAPRLAQAVLVHDKTFFRMLGNALRLPTLRYDDVEYPEMRYLLTLLEPMGVISKLGVVGMYKLFAERLHLYPIQDDSPERAGDQARSLWQFTARWRKELSTKKRRRM